MALTYQTTATKQKTNLPLQDPNNPAQPLPVQPPAQIQTVNPVQAPQQPQTELQQASDKSFMLANQLAQQGFQSPTAQVTSQKTQELLQNPNQGQNYQQYNQNRLEQFDRERADAMEAARQGLAGASGSSMAQTGLMELALKGIEGRADLQTDLDRTSAEQSYQNLLRALAEGRATTQMEQGISKQNIDALLQARQVAEPELERQFQGQQSAIDRGLEIAKANQNAELQTALTQLQGNIQSGLLMQEQTFKSAEDALNRQLEKEIAAGNWQNALELESLRGEIQAQAQQAQRDFERAERIATQSWTTTERIASQDFERASQYLQQEFAKATAEQDFERQKYLQEQEASLQLKMQTNEMDYGEKMAYLQHQLAEARANNDVEREKNVLTFTFSQEMERIRQQQGFEASMQYSQQQFQLAMQANDFTHAETMLTLQQNFQAEEAAKDRVIEMARVELQKRGVDMAQVEQQYNMIQAEIDAGRLQPEAAFQYMESTLGNLGIDFQMADAVETAKQALRAEFELQKEQFMLSHPEYVAGSINGIPTRYTEEGERAFLEFINTTMYGPDATETIQKDLINGVLTAQEIRTDPVKLQAAKDNAIIVSGENVFKDKKGANTYRFTGLPDKNVPFTDGNGYYVRISDPQDVKVTGTNYQIITVIDLDTGKTKKIKSTDL